MTPMRLLGIDFGEKHIGLAIGEKMPQPFGTISAKNFIESIEKIKAICEQEKIAKIIIGLPKSNLPIVKSQALIETENFIELLKTKISLPIETVDEAYSSAEAKRLLAQEKISWQKAKQQIHQMSAVLILNQYLATHEND